MSNNDENRSTLSRLRSSYVILSVNVLTLIILFIAGNVVLAWGIDIAVYFNAVFSGKPQNAISQSYDADLKQVYPGMADDQIAELLHETWSRPYDYAPFTQFKEAPYTGNYVNVDKFGYRKNGKHSTWPPANDAFNVFVFGGSTIFGYGVSDDQTMPAHMLRILNKRYPDRRINVFNLAQGYYYSSQEAVQFLRLMVEGHKPDLAVFIDGLNEFGYGEDWPPFTNDLESFFNQYQLGEDGSASVSVGAQLGSIANTLPIGKAASLIGLRDALKKRSQKENYMSDDLILPILNRYRQNRDAIRALATANDVPVVFVWQPVPNYNYDTSYHLFSDIGFGELGYAGKAYDTARTLLIDGKDDFIWCADIQRDVKAPLYVDRFHYTSKLNAMLAECTLQNTKVQAEISK